MAELTLPQRVAAVQQIYDFQTHAAALGWVAVDLYDGSLMVDLKSGRVTLCDLDVYERAPMINRQGRMWGSTRFMAPEEYELGAVIDEVTNVVALGALAHTFLGDDESKDRAAWVGTDDQFAVAARALDPVRGAPVAVGRRVGRRLAYGDGLSSDRRDGRRRQRGDRGPVLGLDRGLRGEPGAADRGHAGHGQVVAQVLRSDPAGGAEPHLGYGPADRGQVGRTTGRGPPGRT